MTLRRDLWSSLSFDANMENIKNIKYKSLGKVYKSASDHPYNYDQLWTKREIRIK